MADAQYTGKSENHNDAGEYLKNPIDGVKNRMDLDFCEHEGITAPEWGKSSEAFPFRISS